MYLPVLAAYLLFEQLSSGAATKLYSAPRLTIRKRNRDKLICELCWEGVVEER